jgi:hypothetical protein
MPTRVSSLVADGVELVRARPAARAIGSWRHSIIRIPLLVSRPVRYVDGPATAVMQGACRV